MGEQAGPAFAIASTGFKVAGTLFEGFGKKDAAKAQAEAAYRRASYGQIKADQTDVAMRQDLESTMGNIFAVRAAAGGSPDSPTMGAITQGVQAAGDRDRNRAVGNIEAQVREDKIAQRLYQKMGQRALIGSFLTAGGQIMSALSPMFKQGGAAGAGGSP